jgi:hypothetical protein
MRISRWIVMASLAAVASAARGTDVDLRIGTRSFDVERWPEVGVAVAVGPDDRWVRPAFGAAVAFDFLYGGTVLEASAGLAGDLPHRGRVAFGWGLGAALLAYDYGPNHGTQAAGYAELGARWVRPDGVDLGLNLRYLDGSDVELRAEGSTGESFRESLETVVVSFVLRW